jgi:hypothetical protein
MAMADNKKTEAGKPIAASIADARRKLARRKKFSDPPAEEARKGALPGKWTKNDLGMPVEDPCPVVPLGREGAYYHMMDSAGQFRSFTASDFSHSGIQDLFARAPNWPKWCWPRYGRAQAAKDGEAAKPPPIKSFQDDDIREMLMKACSDVGQFSADNKLRGRGAWSLRGGGLIYHAGEELWRCDDNPAAALLETFRCWNWWKKEIDPVLLLGWIGVAYLAARSTGAPAVLLVGDKGTGKSTCRTGSSAVRRGAVSFGRHHGRRHLSEDGARHAPGRGRRARGRRRQPQGRRRGAADARRASGALGRAAAPITARRRVPDALGVFVLGDQQSAAIGTGSLARRDAAAAAARARPSRRRSTPTPAAARSWRG